MIKAIRRVFVIINFKALFVTIAAVASTYLCQRYGLKADLPLTLIATAVIFPIVFSISGAYKRREVALGYYGSIKAHGRAVFFAARDWLENPGEDVLNEAKQRLGDLLKTIRQLLVDPIENMMKSSGANICV